MDTSKFGLTPVEAVKKILLTPHRHGGPERGWCYQGCGGVEIAEELAREICQLFPEYEPVELEVLSWEGIRKVLQDQDKKGITDNMFRLESISQATIERNQSKGQLYRIKE